MIDFLQEQLHWKITDRRIFRLGYIHDKKAYTAEVGQLEPLEHCYEIQAIFESNAYLVFTKAKSGGSGVTILVNRDEAQSVVEFDKG